MSDMACIKDNLENVLYKIDEAAKKSGRRAEDIKLIAVSKTVAVDRIKEITSLGIRDLGENRVQEICDKYDSFEKDINWHLIGQLQTNKVKYIIDKVTMIHSLDRIELAKEIQKRAKNADRIMDVLVEVNVSGEETKSGISPLNVMDFMGQLSEFPNIRVRGLMTVAPFFKESRDTRPIFAALRKLAVDIDNENIHNISMDFLSMGMSNDFEVAIEEGSNIVRIGTRLFGKR